MFIFGGMRRQVAEKVFMLITPTRVGPLAIAMAAQVKGDCMLDRQSSANQCRNEMIPAPSLIAHPVKKNESFFFRLSPLPIVKF